MSNTTKVGDPVDRGGLTVLGPISVQKSDGTVVEVADTNGNVTSDIVLSDGEAIEDSNGNELIEAGVTASAVNHVKVTNAATGNDPVFSAAGTDANINLGLSAKGTGNVEVQSGAGVVSTVANGVLGFYKALAPQALSGAGAVTITEYKTNLSTTGANALTLADGDLYGQLKLIQMIADLGDGTLTPTNLNGGTTITFADVGDCALLVWTGTAWTPVDLYNIVDGATSPALA